MAAEGQQNRTILGKPVAVCVERFDSGRRRRCHFFGKAAACCQRMSVSARKLAYANALCRRMVLPASSQSNPTRLQRRCEAVYFNGAKLS
jgi:hypothetical protein